MSVEIGQQAPDFTLPDQDGNPVKLSDLLSEKNVVLVFYPFTFSSVCEGELCHIRDDLSRFDAEGVQVVAISCNAKHAQKKWASEMGYQFPLLADFWPHGEVARAYGVFNETAGCANRATFVIDRSGRVVDMFASPDIPTPREPERYKEALAKLP